MYDPLSPTGVEIAKIKTASQPPAVALSDAPIVDLWDIIWASLDGRTGVQLAIGGDVEHSSDWLIAVDADFRWGRTAAQIWRLGWPNDARPPIVQTAMWPTRRTAFEHAIERTGKATLPSLLQQAASRATTPLLNQVIAAVAETVRRQGRREVTAAWDLLRVDGTHQNQAVAGAFALGMAVSSMLPRDRDGEVKAMLDAWTRLMQSPTTNPDPFAAAQVGRVPSTYHDVFVRIRDDEENGHGAVH